MEIAPTHVADLAQSFIAYSAPLIAGGALAKVGEDTTDTATGLVQRLWGLLTRQFQGHADADAALTLYQGQADNALRQQLLQEQIIAHFQGQAAAIAELADLVQQLQAAQGAPQAAQQRTLTIRDQAQVGTVVQGDVQGNLTIGPTTFGDQIHAQGSQGFVNRPSGAVKQTFQTPPRREDAADE